MMLGRLMRLAPTALLLCGLLLVTSPAVADETFSQDACWDESCPDEVAACQANPVCKLIAQCIQNGSSVLSCYNDYSSQIAADLYTAIQECGWKSCATNEGSCQGVCSYFGSGVCNCDALCEKYGDCCLDFLDACWEEPAPCEVNCAAKSCGDDGCGGSCGECAINESCDATGQCNDQCPPVCELGESGCTGDVRWTCTPGLGGCPKKTTVDCSGAQMICAHGECAAPPQEPDILSTDTTPHEDVSPGPDPQSDAQVASDTANETEDLDTSNGEPSSDLELTGDAQSALPQTQLAGSSQVGREGCVGADSPLDLWPFLILPMWIRRRRT
jgi:hypothetical protein